jgi:outer membrane lipoprotein-sorting protein
MKLIKTLVFLFVSVLSANSQQQSAKDIVKKAYDLMQGETNESMMTMTIVRPTWQRSISFHTWAKGNDYSLALVTDPAKEKGQTFLKRKNEIWNWVPNIQRMIKLPPSMLSQGWMGSDFSNDDLLKESSIVIDYNHTFIGNENVDGIDCYKVKLIPTADAAVVWGSIIKWISKEDYFQIKSEYYDEDGLLVKTELASDIKIMDDRKIPTRFELIPADKPGNKTLLVLDNAKFNKPINENFFSQQNMKTIR